MGRPKLIPVLRIPPVALDLSLSDLAFALQACLSDRTADPLATQATRQGEQGLVTLCVRSAFDLLLRALALPAGSEVLVGAIVHPDMMAVLRAHGLVPVPIDVEPHALAMRPESLRRAVTARTRALLVVHLFGGRNAVDPLAAFCEAHGLLLWEDCAQAYVDADYHGDPRAQVSMFSFGPLKTATALQGAISWTRDPPLHRRMSAILAADPPQSNAVFAKRILKYAALHVGLQPLPYNLLAAIFERRGTPFIDINRRWMHSFSGPFDVKPLRLRPSPALLRLLARRLSSSAAARVAARARSGQAVAAMMPQVAVPGRGLDHVSWWIFPIQVKDQREALTAFRQAGFEAVRGLSNLEVLDPPPDRLDLEPHEARRIVASAVLLPVRASLSPARAARLAELGRHHGAPCA